MSIILENTAFRLELTEQCIAKSLICKETGEECLKQNQLVPFFSLTEERPYNNEIKLAHPTKRTTFPANRVRCENNKLIVGFELIAFEAVVEFDIQPSYISFTLADFNISPTDFADLSMTPPPVTEFRLIQLPVANRKNFGEWLNVMWDDTCAINVLANSPHARIDSEKQESFRLMTADAVKGIKLKGCSATLIVSASHKLLNAIEDVENNYNLPKGVNSRRTDKINASAYWTSCTTPSNVDEHIAYAKAAGFRMMLIYYNCIFREEDNYKRCNDFEWLDEYPNKIEDLKKMIQKIKAAGLTPGLHFLHTHIGQLTKYVSPVADRRLHLTRYFTLSKPLGLDETEVFVDENPEGSVTHPNCRILKFGGELIYYTDYTTEYPYCFTGCKRGHFNTNIIPHEEGQIGGVLDVSEFGGGDSIYLNQESDLQDEIADKLAEVYNAGFEFVYYDGSEGTNPPFAFHVPNAQYRVYKKLQKAPLYCEGAAKAHFSWHMLSGGNAFDVFPMPVFKEKIAEHPLREAPEMQKDFTRVNFGWWSYEPDTMPDIYEYGTSKAASYDCPITLQCNPDVFESNPRTADNFEVLKRWEDVRRKNWLTKEQKLMLRNPDKEFILLVNEEGEYELAEYMRINLPEQCSKVTAYTFDRQGITYIVLWHTTGEGNLELSLNCNFSYRNQIGDEEICVQRENGFVILPVAGRRYLITDATKTELIGAFENAKLS